MVTSWHSDCGIAVYAKNLTKNLERHCQVTIFADKNPKPESASHEIREGVLEIWHYKKLSLGESMSLLKKSIRQDVIHWQFEYLLFGLTGLLFFLPMTLLLRALGREQIVTLHSIVDRKSINKQLVELSQYKIPVNLLKMAFFVYNFLLGRAAHMVIHNQHGANVLSRQYYIPPSQISVIPHGITVKKGAEKSEGYLLFQGFIKPVKGLHLLVQALPYLFKTLPDARVVVAGKVLDQQYLRGIRRYMDENGIDHVETKTGFLDDEEVDGLFARANVVVAPYKGTVFGSSGVISRAMAHQKPIVYSPVPMFVEELRDFTEQGFAICVDPTDPKQFAESITRMWKEQFDRDKYRQLTEYRAWERTAKDTWKLYKASTG